jgi:NAD(P)-dependent dehydrogenase (short-subunit alcohol dehydrogenase family)
MADRKRTVLAAAALALVGYRALRRAREASLAGEVVLIAGASRGLGLLLAREFAAEGCRLAICARDPQSLEAARAGLEADGAEVLAVPCDVSDPEQVRDLVDRTMERFGRIDVLVNVAAIMQVGPVSAMPRGEFERAMEINFWGTYNTVEAVVPGMRARGAGRIVNIASIGGKLPLPHMLPYCCAKFAMVGFSEGLGVELAKDGISVTTVIPGLVRTGSQTNAFYRGDAAKEWTWFTLSGANPLTSISAGRAARRIVQATRRGEAEVMLSWPAHVLTRVHGVAPGLNTRLMALTNRFLPGAPPAAPGRTRGMEVATPLSPSPATALMNRAARDLNQYAGGPSPSPEHAAKASPGE